MKIKAPIVTTIFMFLPLTSFAQTDNHINDQTDHSVTAKNDTARIRLFGQNGASAKFYAGKACHYSFWSGKGTKVSGSFGSAFGSLIGVSSNKSIGIPETLTTKHLSDKNGILSKAYFKEYEIPANQATTVTMSFQDVGSFYQAAGMVYSYTPPYCGGSIFFTAKPNTDYEAGFSWDANACHLTINEVVKKGDQLAELLPVEAQPAPECK